MFGKKGKKEKSRRKRRRSSRSGGHEIESIELGGEPTIQPPRQKGLIKNKKMTAWLTGVRFASKWLGLWALLALAGLFSHSAWFADETRFLSMAWEMWDRGIYLIPLLNGEPMPATSPLLLWLMQAGWMIFGVNSWWPQLLPALFSLGSLLLVGWIARCLWPGQVEIGRYAPLILLSITAWAMFSTLLMSDLALVFFVVLALWALVLMGCRGSRVGGLLLGLALGLGALSNGLIIFWIVLPISVLAPFWVSEGSKIHVNIWYQQILLATAIGAAILGCWLVPVSESFGQPYAMLQLQQFLVPQPVTIFSNSLPWLGYLFLLPLVLLPWSMWPLVLSRLWHVWEQKLSGGFRLCLIQAVTVFVVFSVINVRQPQFMLSIFPFYALAVAYLLLDDGLVAHGKDSIWTGMSFPIIGLGGVLAVLPRLPEVEFLPAFLWTFSPLVGVIIALVGIGIGWLPMAPIRQRIMTIAITSIMLVVFSVLITGWYYKDYYDVSTTAKTLANMQRDGRAVAHIGEYQGRFHFIGRLHKPFAIISEEQILSWAAANKQGIIISYDNVTDFGENTVEPVHQAQYQGTRVRLWNASSFVGVGS